MFVCSSGNTDFHAATTGISNRPISTGFAPPSTLSRSAQNALIKIVPAYPKPYQTFGAILRKSAVCEANPYRPQIANLLPA